MVRKPNTSSLENFNGSAYSANSSRTHLSHDTTMEGRTAAPTHHSLNRNHSYPASVARDFHYADNYAVGHDIYHANGTAGPPVTTYQHSPPSSYAASGQNTSQMYLLPAANYSATTYDQELDLEDGYLGAAVSSSTYLRRQTAGLNHQTSPDSTYRGPPPANEYRREATSWSSQQGSDEDEDPYYVEQYSASPQRESSNARPQSPTQRYLQESSPHDRLRLGLRRYETREEQDRAYEPATRFESSSRHRSSRNGSTRRH